MTLPGGLNSSFVFVFFLLKIVYYHLLLFKKCAVISQGSTYIGIVTTQREVNLARERTI